MEIQIPPVVAERYQQLYDLCQSAPNGRLKTADVAEYLGVDLPWLLRQLDNGKCPFGFGSKKDVDRGNNCIDVLQFFNYIVPIYTYTAKHPEVQMLEKARRPRPTKWASMKG